MSVRAFDVKSDSGVDVRVSRQFAFTSGTALLMWYKTNEVPALQEKTKLARTKSEMQKAQNGEWS